MTPFILQDSPAALPLSRLTLGAASLTAMPVQAASPSFNFQLGIGNDGGVMGFDGNQAPSGSFPIKKCLTNSQVERGLERYGFDDVDVVKKLSSSRVLVIAEWDYRYYSMTVNKCSGRGLRDPQAEEEPGLLPRQAGQALWRVRRRA